MQNSSYLGISSGPHGSQTDDPQYFVLIDIQSFDDPPPILMIWTIQSTTDEPVSLTILTFDVGTMLPTPTNISANMIWSPNYPNNYDNNYQQVSTDTSINYEIIEVDILGVETGINNRKTCHTHIRSI